MEAGKLVLAKDRNSERAQFSAILTSESVNITAPTQLNADLSLYVSINPTGGEAYVSVEDTATLSAVGKFVSSEYAIIVPAGHYLGATAEINVTPLGYDKDA